MVIEKFVHNFIELLYAPVIYPEMLWIIIPVIISISLMEFYFRKYPREGMGHHKSLENTIFLLFISFDLIRDMFNEYAHHKLVVSILFITIWSIIAYLDFNHKLPTNLFFNRSSKFIIGYFSYIAVVLVYSKMLEEIHILNIIYVLISAVLFFMILVGIKKGFELLQPRSYEEIEGFLENIENDLKKSIKEENGIINKKSKAKRT